MAKKETTDKDQLDIDYGITVTAEEFFIRDVRKNGTLDNPARIIKLMEDFAELKLKENDRKNRQ